MADDPSFTHFAPPERGLPRPAGPRCERRMDEYVQAVLFMRRSGWESLSTAAVVALVAFLRKEWDAPSVGLVEQHCERIAHGWWDPAAPASLKRDTWALGRKSPLEPTSIPCRGHRSKRKRVKVLVEPGEVHKARLAARMGVSGDEIGNLLRPNFAAAAGTKSRWRRRLPTCAIMPFPKVDPTGERSDPSPG